MAESCVFCDRSELEERIIAETPSLYFVATLGQLTDGGYILVIPKRHVSCIAAMDEDGVAEIEAAMLRGGLAINAEYGAGPTAFEHGIVGQTIGHAHLHILPARISFGSRVLSDFPSAKTDIIASFETLRKKYAARGGTYLLWRLPDPPGVFSLGVFQVLWDPPAPPQYLRTVAAKLVGHPERANWRNMSSLDKERDQQFVRETISRLRPRLP